MFGIDWIIWGVIIAAATLGAAIGVPVVLYIRQNRANITVTSEFDKTGFVEVVLAKEEAGPRKSIRLNSWQLAPTPSCH